MKTTLLTCLCSIALALNLLGQTATPITSPSAQSAISATSLSASSPAPSASVAEEEGIERAVERKLHQHFGATVDGHRKHDVDDTVWLAVPIVMVVFLSIFGAPVLIVAVIMYFGFSRNRMMHRTVRMMVEKGQPVPPELLQAPPPARRQRSDLRRGTVLMMVGLGVAIFFGVVCDWDSGVWSLGAIPFLIGAGYLLVWRLEGRKDKVPPLA